MQARKERLCRNTKKSKNVSGWGGRSADTPNPSAIKGKLNIVYMSN